MLKSIDYNYHDSWSGSYTDFTGGLIAPHVAVSDNNGTNFARDTSPANAAQAGNTVNPGTRIATDSLGNVYSIFGLGP